jgi:hypothetical protein
MLNDCNASVLDQRSLFYTSLFFLAIPFPMLDMSCPMSVVGEEVTLTSKSTGCIAVLLSEGVYYENLLQPIPRCHNLYKLKLKT